MPNSYCYEVDARSPDLAIAGGRVEIGNTVSVSFSAPDSATPPLGQTAGFSEGPIEIASLSFGSVTFPGGSDVAYYGARLTVDTGRDLLDVSASPRTIELSASSTLTAIASDVGGAALTPPDNAVVYVGIGSVGGGDQVVRGALVTDDTTFVSSSTGVTYGDLAAGRMRLIPTGSGRCGTDRVVVTLNGWVGADGILRGHRTSETTVRVCGDLVVEAGEVWPGRDAPLNIERRTAEGSDELGPDDAVDIRLGAELAGLVSLRRLDTNDAGAELLAVPASVIASGEVVLTFEETAPASLLAVTDASPPSARRSGEQAGSPPPSPVSLPPGMAVPNARLSPSGRPGAQARGATLPGTIAGIPVSITATLTADASKEGGGTGVLYPFAVDADYSVAQTDGRITVTADAGFRFPRLDHVAVQDFAARVNAVPVLNVQVSLTNLFDGNTYAPVGIRPVVTSDGGGTVYPDQADYTYLISLAASATQRHPFTVEFSDPSLVSGGSYVASSNVALRAGGDFLRPTSGEPGLFDQWEALRVGASQTLTVTAAPDTLSAGGEAHFTIDAPGLDPATPVTLSVPDLTLGWFVAAGTAARGSASDQRARSVAATVGTIGEVVFHAIDDAPPEFETVSVTAQAGGRSGTVDVTIRPLGLRLLRQNGAEVEAGYVMVSRVRPDWLLDFPSLPFAPPPRANLFPETGPPTSTQYDPHTYRPEATGVELGIDPSTVRFQLTVRRRGTDVEIWNDGIEGGAHDLLTEYPAVCELEGVDRQACRATQYIRFVSNARPANLSGETRDCEDTINGTCYDDEHLGTQTIRVELGDVVRWELLVRGSSRGVQEYTVGALLPSVPGAPAPDPYDVPQTVRVRFIGTNSLEVPMDPAGTVRQVNQMWAQAGLSFSPLPSLSDVPDLVRQFIEIDTREDDIEQRSPRFPRAGTIRGRIGDGEWTSLAVGRNSPVHPAIEALVRMLGLSLETDVQVVTHEAKARADGSLNYSTLLCIRTGVQLSVEIQDVDTGVRIRNRNVASSRMAQEETQVGIVTIAEHVLALEMHAMALRYGSENEDIIDVFVVPNDALDQLGGLRGYAYGARQGDGGIRALVNTVVLRAAAADGDDAPAPGVASATGGYPHTAGHEIGHVLFNVAFPGSDSGGHADPTSTYNVMAAGPTVSGNQLGLGSRRRLRYSQQIDARTSQPSLLLPPVLGPTAPRQRSAEDPGDVVSRLTSSVAPGPVPVSTLPERE